jgi:hypothetical protein
MDHNIARGYGKFQANDLSDIYFLAEHGRNSRLAYVYRMSPYHCGIPRIDADVNVQLVTRMTAGFGHG